MNVVIGEYPPTHVARHMALFECRDGLTWCQKGRGVRLGTESWGEPIYGGADWELFTPTGVQTGIYWSSDGFSEVSAVVSVVNHAFTSPNTATDDFFTELVLKRTIRCHGLVVPLMAYTSGTIDVKAGLYQSFPSKVYMAHKLADSRLTFALSGFTPVAKEPTLIPYSSATQDPLILRKGSRLWVRSIWGSLITGGQFVLRHPQDYSGGGSSSNHFRKDRFRSATINYTTATATLMAEKFTTGAAIGSSAGSTSMGRINWGIYGEILD